MKPSLIFILIFISIFSAKLLAQQKVQISFKEILMEEIARHPHSKVEDIYKFIHQAAFGSEHAVKDSSAVRKWLENEIEGLDYSLNDNLIEPLSPDGQLVRVNIRTYLKEKFDLNLLLDAFIKTANSYKGSVKTFMIYWKIAQELAKADKFSFTVFEMDIFFESQSKRGFPAVHHSQLYERNYKPAYRVVDLQYLPFIVK